MVMATIIKIERTTVTPDKHTSTPSSNHNLDKEIHCLKFNESEDSVIYLTTRNFDTLAKVIIIDDTVEEFLKVEEVNFNDMEGLLLDMKKQLGMIRSGILSIRRKQGINAPSSTRSDNDKGRKKTMREVAGVLEVFSVMAHTKRRRSGRLEVTELGSKNYNIICLNQRIV